MMKQTAALGDLRSSNAKADCVFAP